MRRAGKTSETLIDSGGDASLAGSLAVSVFRHGSTGLLPGNDRKRERRHFRTGSVLRARKTSWQCISTNMSPKSKDDLQPSTLIFIARSVKRSVRSRTAG